ncbi:hypothetical protein [Streptomyces sp. NPDC058664]|uniref:hypothetical protein n=1 Tax=unclassified Streptomyces TaxID=2593676 RepID=UPI003656C240
MARERIRWPLVVERARQIVDGDAPSKVTLRQVMYRLVSEGVLPHTPPMHRRLSARLAQARREGRFPDLIDTISRYLLGQVHAQAAEPPTVPGDRGPAVSRASLQADLLAADARTARLAAHARRLETRLSEVLGEQVWRECGIGGSEGTEQLKARLTTLKQQVVDLELKLQDQGEDLAAAQAANRELMAQLKGPLPCMQSWAGRWSLDVLAVLHLAADPTVET